jgi:hypothetical protein
MDIFGVYEKRPNELMMYVSIIALLCHLYVGFAAVAVAEGDDVQVSYGEANFFVVVDGGPA